MFAGDEFAIPRNVAGAYARVLECGVSWAAGELAVSAELALNEP